MSLPKGLKLRSGDVFPLVGLGTWRSKPGEVGAAVSAALDAGYKSMDFAWIYGNEPEIGAVLKERVGKQHPRESLFLTTKLWPTFYRAEHVESAFNESLTNLGLDYLDLYLMHWPFAYQFVNKKVTNPRDASGKQMFDETWKIEETWAELEKLVKKGKVRNIGVCNFGPKSLEKLLKVAKIKPAVNQVELHPYNPQSELLQFCKENGIVVTAYSPLGSDAAPVLQDPTVHEIAKKLSLTPAQVLLSWAATRGTTVIPKSVKPERIRENMNVVELDSADMAKINGITKRVRYVAPPAWLEGAQRMWGHGLFE